MFHGKEKRLTLKRGIFQLSFYSINASFIRTKQLFRFPEKFTTFMLLFSISELEISLF